MRAIASVFVLGSTLGLSFAACAESKETSAAPDSGLDASAPADATSAEDASDAAPHSPCDAGDPTCTPETIPCSAADWCPVETPVKKTIPLTAVWGSGAADVWTVGAGGAIAHWDGTRWTTTASGTTYTLRAVWGANAQDVWAVGTSDVILHSVGFTNDSATWERVQPIRRPNGTWELLMRSVWGPADGNEILIGGVGPVWEGAPVWGSERDPVVWLGYSDIPKGPSIHDVLTVYGMWGSRADDLWIVGDIAGLPGEEGGGGAALHGKTRGADAASGAFVRTDIRALNRLEAVWGSSESDVWAVGTHGTIRHYTSGTRWDIVSSPTLQDLHAVWGTGANDVWVVGDKGTLLHWDGANWKTTVASLPVGQKPNFYGVWGSGPTDVWVVGERGTVLHFTGMKSTTQGEGP